jgi:ankyrin repeat protein
VIIEGAEVILEEVVGVDFILYFAIILLFTCWLENCWIFECRYDKWDWKKLFAACIYGAKGDIVKVIERGVDPNVTNNEGISALSYCALMDLPDAIKTLILSGACVDGVVDGVLPPLFAAIRKNNFECVKALVKAGADVNYTNEDEISPLKTAVVTSSIEIVEYLLENGAKIRQEGHECSALELAITSEAPNKIIDLLLMHDEEELEYRQESNDENIDFVSI